METTVGVRNILDHAAIVAGHAIGRAHCAFDLVFQRRRKAVTYPGNARFEVIGIHRILLGCSAAAVTGATAFTAVINCRSRFMVNLMLESGRRLLRRTKEGRRKRRPIRRETHGFVHSAAARQIRRAPSTCLYGRKINFLNRAGRPDLGVANCARNRTAKAELQNHDAGRSMDISPPQATSETRNPAKELTRVLVIDDDDSVSAAIQAILAGRRCETVITSRAYAGIRALQQSVFDVVMLDIFMPA